MRRNREKLNQREPVYARHASAAFNRRMHKILQDLSREIASELGDKLYAVLLGGNYGRGEGGTRRVVEGHGSGVWSIGEAPAEDIDLLVVSWFRFPGRAAAIRQILSKYEGIFSVPIDLLPMITPLRLYYIPFRFNWRRLIRNSAVLYGPKQLSIMLSRRYGNQKSMNPLLSWSLLLDQGLRLIEALARDQGVIHPDRARNLVIHQGKYFREIAQAILLVTGRYQDVVDLQLHEFIWIVEGGYTVGPHLRLLKTMLPKALLILKSPEQAELDLPENWLFHIHLWLEAYNFLADHIHLPSGLLLMYRLKKTRACIETIAQNSGLIHRRDHKQALGLIRLLDWLRTHIMLI